MCYYVFLSDEYSHSIWFLDGRTSTLVIRVKLPVYANMMAEKSHMCFGSVNGSPLQPPQAFATFCSRALKCVRAMQLQGVFPTMIGFVTLGHLFVYRGSGKKRWPSVTKPIMVGKTPCKLLCTFEVKVSNK